MPIKSRIDVGADPEQFKRSLALLQRYQTALKELYGASALKAPYVRDAADAGGDLVKFIDPRSCRAVTDRVRDGCGQSPSCVSRSRWGCDADP